MLQVFAAESSELLTYRQIETNVPMTEMDRTIYIIGLTFCKHRSYFAVFTLLNISCSLVAYFSCVS
jgi:hypothetical protein